MVSRKACMAAILVLRQESLEALSGDADVETTTPKL
jgi:hypothetical protein